MYNNRSKSIIANDILSLKQSIYSFQVKQEKKLLQISDNSLIDDDIAGDTSSGSAGVHTYKNSRTKTLASNKKEILFNKKTNQHHSFAELKQFLNVDVILSPSFQLTVDGDINHHHHPDLKVISWPQALIANYGGSYADISNFESYGSVWKLQERIDFVGTNKKHIILQSCEIGEAVMYMTKKLNTTAKKENAAVWEVVVVDDDKRSKGVDDNNYNLLFTSDSSCNNNKFDRSITVRFVLCNDTGSSTINPSYLAASVTNQGLRGVSLQTQVSVTENAHNCKMSIDWTVVIEEAYVGTHTYIIDNEIDNDLM